MKQIYTILAIALGAFYSCGSPQSDNNAEASSPAKTLETIMSRKSVRQYSGESVTEAQTETLLQAAMAAPSGIDVRPWRFIVVTDPEVKAALGGQPMYKSCSVLIVVCGQTEMTDREGNLRENHNWTADCAAATENILLAAEALGLGAVWTACYPYENRMNITREVLGIPEGITPYSVIPVGHPAGETPVKDKWNPDNIHYNKW